MARTTLKPKQAIAYADPQVGEIADIDENGRALVRFPGSAGSVSARSVLDSSVRVGEEPRDLVGASVLLAFENSDPGLPIIVGLIRESLRPERALPEFRLDLGSGRDVLVDGRRLVLDAQEQILIRCGKSSILLQRDGKVLIRGAHVVSRSSGPNKIKGGSVSLN